LLKKIFEYLVYKVDLRSCLLVNRLWCEVSVQILWTKIQNYDTLISCHRIKNVPKNLQPISSGVDDKITLVTREIFKMFMKPNFFEKTRILSFKILFKSTVYHLLRNLSELECDSNLSPKFFRQMCHNLQSLELSIGKVVSYELANLISIQPNLMYLSILDFLLMEIWQK